MVTGSRPADRCVWNIPSSVESELTVGSGWSLVDLRKKNRIHKSKHSFYHALFDFGYLYLYKHYSSQNGRLFGCVSTKFRAHGSIKVTTVCVDSAKQLIIHQRESHFVPLSQHFVLLVPQRATVSSFILFGKTPSKGIHVVCDASF